MEGKGPFEICRIMHEDKVERPSYYMAKRGYVAYHGALEAEDPYLWGTHMITFILARPEYAGHTVNFRTVKPSYKS
ncbi:MAG: recombinase, partial [Kiritimatiellaeota bacterium]|nr:recombinase [Kiritimatiellota bacterium]